MKELVDYWKDVARYDYRTMKVLFENKRYAYTLFFGHLVLEKILKAHVVQKTRVSSPYTHNLMHLASQLADGIISEDQKKLLREVNEFNVRARYPDIRYSFYKRCTKLYTFQYYTKITHLYRRLWRLLK